MKPEFHLSRVFDDGTSEPPQVVPVTEMPWSTSMDRRGALAAGLGLSGVLAMIGCAEPEAPPQVSRPKKPRPKPKDCAASPADSILAHRGAVFDLAVSANGKIVASKGYNEIKLWSLPERKKIGTLEVSVSAITLSLDGERLAAIHNGEIELWSVARRRKLQTFKPETFLYGGTLALSPNGELLATSAGGETQLRNLANGKDPVPIAGTGTLLSLAFSPDGTLLAAGLEEGSVRVYDVASRRQLFSWKEHNRGVRDVAFTPDGRMVVSGSADRSVKLWSTTLGRRLASLGSHTDEVSGVAAGGSDLLASASTDKTIKLWSSRDRHLLGTLQGHRHAVNAIAMTADGKTLISADAEGAIAIWDLEEWERTGNCSHTFLFDRADNDPSTKAVSYDVEISGRTITYTLPCGSPIPAGATCTCNCVPGRWSPPPPPEPDYDDSGGGYGYGTYCSCNKICTCVPISSRRWKRNIEPLRGAREAHTIAHRITLLVDAIQSQQRRLADLRQRLRG